MRVCFCEACDVFIVPRDLSGTLVLLSFHSDENTSTSAQQPFISQIQILRTCTYVYIHKYKYNTLGGFYSVKNTTQRFAALLQDPEKLDLVGDLYHMNFVSVFRSAVLLHFCNLYSICNISTRSIVTI